MLRWRERSPAGWRGLAYWRWHGSPRIYSSAYPPEPIETLRSEITVAAERAPVWCIFNNTMHAAATGHALDLTYGQTAD